MEPDLYKQELELCFIEFENLQVQHIDIMKNESMPDIAAMTQKRDDAFIRLKNNLDRFVKNAGSHDKADSLSDLRKYEIRLASIMDVSQELSKVTLEYKDKLTAGLAKIQQGKAAMQGYKTANMNY